MSSIYGKAELAISKLILEIKNKREKTARSRGSFFISFLFTFLSIKETLHRREVTDQWQNKTLTDTDEVF